MEHFYDLDADDVIITSSETFVHVIDPKTGNGLKTYKCPKLSPKCLALLGHDYFIGAPSSVPDIRIWPVRNENSMVSSPCGIVNVLAVTHCGKFCVAAIKQEIRVWDVQIGEMLASFSPHYQEITCLQFTSDDSMLLSGGRDGNVLVFYFESVCSVNADPNVPVQSLYSWNDHAVEVTDIYLTELGVFSRVATTSLDMTCKIYELETGLLLTTMVLNLPLTSVIMDPLEYHVIVGTTSGTILKVNIYDELPREIHRNSLENEEVQAHEHAVIGLSCTSVGDKFLSTAIQDKFCKIWDIASFTCFLKVSCSDGPITNAFFTQSPSPLLTKADKYFNVSQLDRDFPNPQDRSRSGGNKAYKVHAKPLSLIHASGIDEFYSPVVLSGKIHTPVMTPSESVKSENLYQEKIIGETISDVRKVNTQLYYFMVGKIFQNMDPPLPKDPQIEDC